MEKYELIPEQLLYEGTIERSQFFHPDQLSYEQLLTTHDVEYLDKLKYQTLSPKEIRRIGFPMTPQLVDRGRVISMATYQCALYAMSEGVSLNIAGGTHHAYPDHGEGFCIFNDVAVAANLLLKDNPNLRILVIDLDVHQGNGTAYIFKSQPQVFTFSMHGQGNYPYRKEVSDWDIGLEKGVGDAAYLTKLDEALNELPRKFPMDIIFYISGVDVLSVDRLGTLALSLAGCQQRDEKVFSFAKRNNIPIIAVMGGGYARQLSHIIDAHANTFRTAVKIWG